MLIINTSNNTIKLPAKEILRTYYTLKVDTTKTITIVDEIQIDQNEYYILDLDTNVINKVTSGKDESRYLIFHIDYKSIGALPSEFDLPLPHIKDYSIVAPTVVNGSFSLYWIAKNNLFSVENKPDSVQLINKYKGEAFFRDNAQFRLAFIPSINFLSFSTYTNGLQKFEQGFYGRYKIAFPNSSDVTDDVTSKITLKYIP